MRKNKEVKNLFGEFKKLRLFYTLKDATLKEKHEVYFKFYINNLN